MSTLIFNRASDNYLFHGSQFKAGSSVDYLRLSSADANAYIDISNGGSVNINGTFTVNGEPVASGDTIVLRTTDQDISGIKTFNNLLKANGGLEINNTAVTSSATELNILDGVRATTDELNLLDGATEGTVVASKAVIADTNKDISGIRIITIEDKIKLTNGGSPDGGEIYASASPNEIIIDPYALDTGGDSSGVLTIKGNLNVMGTTTTINSTIVEISDNAIVLGKTGTLASHIDGAGLILGATDGFSGPRPHIVYRDVGQFEFNNNINVTGTITGDTSITLDSTTITTAELGVLDNVTPGIADPSKALVLNANRDIGNIRNLTIDGEFTDGNYTFDTNGNVSGLGTVGCGAITSNGNLAVTGTITGDTSITLDAITVTSAELSVLNGSTSATTTNVVDADRVVLNDNGIMRQVAVTDLADYFDDKITVMENLVSVGILNSGSITDGFGAIDNGASGITTTGTLTYGTLSDGITALTTTVAELNYLDITTLGTSENSKVVTQSSSGVITITGNLLPSNNTAKIPVTKSTFAIQNNSTTLGTDISNVSNTWITPSGYSQNITLISSNSAVKMEFKVNFRASPEADQLISFRVYRNSESNIVFQDSNLGSTMGVTLTNVYNGTFIDTTPGGTNPTYTLQYYLHCPAGDTIDTQFGILGGSTNSNYIFLQELYSP